MRSYKKDEVKDEDENASVEIDFKEKTCSLYVDKKEIQEYRFDFDVFTKVAFVHAKVERKTGEMTLKINHQLIGEVIQHDSFKQEMILVSLLHE